MSCPEEATHPSRVEGNIGNTRENADNGTDKGNYAEPIFTFLFENRDAAVAQEFFKQEVQRKRHRNIKKYQLTHAHSTIWRTRDGTDYNDTYEYRTPELVPLPDYLIIELNRAWTDLVEAMAECDQARQMYWNVKITCKNFWLSLEELARSSKEDPKTHCTHNPQSRREGCAGRHSQEIAREATDHIPPWDGGFALDNEGSRA